MSAPVLLGCGLVSALGGSAPASCAALRAGIEGWHARPFGANGAAVFVAEAPFARHVSGAARLLRLAARAAGECLAGWPALAQQPIPLLLAVAEGGRPGACVEPALLPALQAELKLPAHAASALIPRGRVGVAIALHRARQLLEAGGCRAVLVVGVDSLLETGTLDALAAANALASPQQRGACIPGEAAAALLLGLSDAPAPLTLVGLGFGRENAAADNAVPLRAEGLSNAIRQARDEAGAAAPALLLADFASEPLRRQEAVMALCRVGSNGAPLPPLWLPAELLGDTGAAAGALLATVAVTATRRGYAPGGELLLTLGNDSGERAALWLRAS